MRELEGETYVDQIFQLARDLGLLRYTSPSGEEKPRYQPGPNLPEWEKYQLIDQVRVVLAEWKKSTTWYDVLVNGGLIYPSSSTISTVRKALLHHLLSCLPERWYRLDALLYALFKEQPIPFSRHDLISRYDRQPSQPRHCAHFGNSGCSEERASST